MKKLLSIVFVVVLSACSHPNDELINAQKKHQQKELVKDAMREVVYQWRTTIDGKYNWQLMPDRRFVQALFMPGVSEPYIVTRARRPGEVGVDTFYISLPPDTRYTIAESKPLPEF